MATRQLRSNKITQNILGRKTVESEYVMCITIISVLWRLVFRQM